MVLKLYFIFNLYLYINKSFGFSIKVFHNSILFLRLFRLHTNLFCHFFSVPLCTPTLQNCCISPHYIITSFIPSGDHLFSLTAELFFKVSFRLSLNISYIYLHHTSSFIALPKRLHLIFIRKLLFFVFFYIFQNIS